MHNKLNPKCLLRHKWFMTVTRICIKIKFLYTILNRLMIVDADANEHGRRDKLYVIKYTGS